MSKKIHLILKTNALTVIFLMIFQHISVSFSQSNQDFAPIGAEWYFGRTFFSTSAIDYNMYHVLADTMINSKLCKTIEVLHSTCNLMPKSFYFYQDSDKIYYNSKADDSFLLLYDFGKKSGESWWMEVRTYYDESIDSILISVIDVSNTIINDHSMDVMNITMGKSDNWIGFDGKIYKYIGHEKDLFPFIHGACDESFNHMLRCFISDTNSLSVVFDSQKTCDYSNVKIMDFNYSTLNNIYPNPVENFLFFENSNHNKIQISIYDYLGRIIINTTTTDNYLQVQDINKGFYILKLNNITKKETSMNKFYKL
jgi:hypothetical protein